MTDQIRNTRSPFPHHRLVAYQVATQLLVAVRKANIRDSKLRDEALRSAKSVCLNVAEACGRATRSDKSRVYAIARGEAAEVVAAIEIAEICGDVEAGAAAECRALGGRVVALLSGLMR